MKQKFVLFICSLTIVSALCIYSKANEPTDIHEEYGNYIESVADDYGICPEVIEAMIFVESSGEPNATNGTCVGLMQVCKDCHSKCAERLGVTDYYDPEQNILLGTDYLAELLEGKADGDIAYALDLYNGNSKADYNYENGIVSDYANKVLTLSAELEREHNK